MKLLKSIIPLLFMALSMSCSDTGNGGQGGDDKGRPKTFVSITEAAKAAQADMLAAIENKVDFGVDAAKLRSATPGAPVMKYDVNWEALLQADSIASLENMTKGEPVIASPFIIGPEVVAVATIRNDNNQYSIASLGDKQLSTELDMISRVTGRGTEGVMAYDVPNLNAIVYAVKDSSGSRYYTSYNNASIRESMPPAVLIRVLRADAEAFQKTYGEDLKKGNLVR